MHILFNLIPRNNKSCTMRTKNRTCRICNICLTVIGFFSYYFLTVVARTISFVIKRQCPGSMSIFINSINVIPNCCRRCKACYYTHFSFCFRLINIATHLINVCHCPAYIFWRNFQSKIIIRFKQY